MFFHGFKQHQRTVNVVVVILQRHSYAFSHGLKPCEMYNAVDLVFSENFVHGGCVAHIGVVKPDAFSGDFFHSAYAFFAGISHIVKGNYVIAAI